VDERNDPSLHGLASHALKGSQVRMGPCGMWLDADEACRAGAFDAIGSRSGMASRGGKLEYAHVPYSAPLFIDLQEILS